MLARRGLTESAVLPISLVLATLRERYVAGLTSYRHDAPADSPAASAAINAWLDTFVDAAEIAVDQSEHLRSEIDELRDDWERRLSAHRASLGLRRTPRADSAVARLLAQLPEAPVTTAAALGRILDVSVQAAKAALDELHAAGILRTKSIERGATAFISREVLDLITFTERALASTKFDTRASVPNRPVPALPRR